MKTDARVRYTLNIIQDVFLELLKEKPLSKITVKEICDKAEINRGTFYKHYQDVYDLMDHLETSALDQFRELLSVSEEKGSYSGLITLLTFLQAHRELIESLSGSIDNSHFTSRLADTCTQYALSHLNENNFMNNPQKKYVYSYIAGGTSSLISHWLQNGTNESPQQIAETIDFLNKECLLQ